MSIKRIEKRVIAWPQSRYKQGKESTGAAYAAAGTSIAGHQTAQGLNDQATRVEFTGRISGAEINQKAAIDSARLQAISTIN
jgi:hypothetical protein